MKVSSAHPDRRGPCPPSPSPSPVGLIAIVSILLAPGTTTAQTIALRGATIHTAAGPSIPNGTLLIRDGRIAAVGANVSVPAAAEVIDVSGKEIIPGMLDNHSHIGFDVRDVNEFPVRFGPQHRIIDVLSPDDELWRNAVAGGVTTIVTGPGSGEVSSGQAAVVKTCCGRLEGRVLKERGGLKIAMGRKSPNQTPTTSMAVTALLRQKFIEAQEYRDKLQRWEDGGREGPAPPRDLGMEVLVRVLNGEERVRSHVHSAHDILSVIRLSQEFGFDLTLHHATEAYKVVDQIAEAGVKVVGLPLFLRIGLGHESMYTGKTMTDRGILFAFHTDDPVVASKWQRGNAALGIRYGMSEDEALRAVTINGARIAGVDERVGSLEVGKDADFVVLNGRWYEPRTLVDMVFVDGNKAYDRAEEER